MRILLIDDDTSLCRLLKKQLEHDGMTAEAVHTGKTALDQLEQKQYDLVVLDVMLPETDGFEVLRQLRVFSTVPVLMLTARDNNEDKVLGLRLGADDYLTKPFNLSEFSARVHSLIRRSTVFSKKKEADHQIIAYPGIQIDPESRKVIANEKIVNLPAKEFDMLYYLASHPSRVMTKKQIYEAVWQEEYLYDDSNIMAHISKIRQKIGKDYIKTIKGVGYCFNVGGADES